MHEHASRWRNKFKEPKRKRKSEPRKTKNSKNEQVVEEKEEINM